MKRTKHMKRKYEKQNRKLWQQNPTWGLYISFLQSRHSSMEGIARQQFRQNLRGDSDWIDFMMFGIRLLQELLHRLLCFVLVCYSITIIHRILTYSRRISYYRHLTSQQLLNLPWDIHLVSPFARTRAEIQTVCYAALRLQGWSLARQEPIAAQAILGSAKFQIKSHSLNNQVLKKVRSAFQERTFLGLRDNIILSTFSL